MTTLDLGPDDRDAEFVWGANLTLRRQAPGADRALRRPASTSTATRRTGSGACTPPAGASATSPRPASTTGARARTRASAALSRAAYDRGRNSRRYDARKGVAPPLAAELRTLAGCLWHIVRRRCGNGIVLTALTLGRLRGGARARSRCRPSTRDPDYLQRPLRHARAPRPARRAGCATRAPTCAPARARRRARRAGARGTQAARARALASCGRRTPARRREIGHELGALAPRRAAADRRARRGRREVGQPQRRADRPPAARLPLAADRRRRRRAAARLPRRLPLARRAPRLPPRPARARVRLARRLGGHPPPPRPDSPGARASSRSAR